MSLSLFDWQAQLVVETDHCLEHLAPRLKLIDGAEMVETSNNNLGVVTMSLDLCPWQIQQAAKLEPIL